MPLRNRLVATLFFVGLFFTARCQSIELNTGWQFRRADTGIWHAATVPGTIHTDLLAVGLIPDPYYGDNEKRVQWVEDADWEYRCTFSVPDSFRIRELMALQFDGLDTYADVYLNDSLLLHADNMFRQWTHGVFSIIRRKSVNELRIRFSSAARLAKTRKQNARIPYPDNERIYVRKAQYQFGWDWGPRLVTTGIWRPVRLAAIPVSYSQGPPEDIPIRLVTKNDSLGQSFYFTKNGKPVYIKGANWIPCDDFIPRAVREDKYKTLLVAAKDAGINMLRVWGGGIYEDDRFYNLCDSLDIMVWQDFMFAGAMYPGDSLFIDNVKQEIKFQVERLRHHRCIALWCGNNEIDEGWHNWGWQKALNYSAADSAQIWSDYRKLFHDIIPSSLKELDPKRPYWPSSPSTGWGRDSAYKKGDVHYWGVWWGKEPVEKYQEKVGRFVSEYGMQAFPDMATLKAFSTSADFDTASAVMKAHQKHPFGFENLKMYVSNRFRLPDNFQDFAYVTQLMQADAIGEAIIAHRSRKPYNMGTMYWQLNDCWPGISWSSIDYYGRKKALHYRLKKLYAPVLIAGSQTPGFTGFDHVCLASDSSFSGEVVLEQVERRLDGKSLTGAMAESVSRSSYELRIGQGFRVDIVRDQYGPDSLLFYELRLKHGNRLITSSIVLPLHPKDMAFTKPHITYKISGKKLILRSDVFAYGVRITVPDGIELSDNYFHLLPGREKEISLSGIIPKENWSKEIKIRSLADTYLSQ